MIKKSLWLLLFVTCLLLPSATLRIAQGADYHSVSCQQPTQNQVELCRERAAMLLGTTVRLRVELWRVKPDESGYEWEYSVGHATFKAERYLVTHNHFSVPIAEPCVAARCGDYITISLYDYAGRFLFTAPLRDFNVAVSDRETLVLELIRLEHREMLKTKGIVPAAFESLSSADLQPGMEVGQVDWDGVTARIDWTVIQEIIIADGTPRLVLSDGVNRGASGGGVFENGRHIGTIWTVSEHLDSVTGVVLYRTSTAALNSDAIVQ